MSIEQCPRCGFTNPEFSATIKLRFFHELKDPNYLRSLKAAAASLHFPRRSWRLNLIAWLEEFEGDFFDESFVRLDTLPNVDAIFSDDDDDKWVGDFAQPCSTDSSPRLYKKVWRRVQLIDAYVRHQYPSLARSIGRRAANDNLAPLSQ